MLQADGDETVPNAVINNPLIGSAPFAGTEPLANKLVLNSISASVATLLRQLPASLFSLMQ